MNKKQITALAEMGITEAVFKRVHDSATQQEGEARLDEAKAICKKGFRELALKLHPDVNDGEDKRFRYVKSVYEGFMKARYKGWRRRSTTLRDDPGFAPGFGQRRTRNPFDPFVNVSSSAGPNPFGGIYGGSIHDIFARASAAQEARRSQNLEDLLQTLRYESGMGRKSTPKSSPLRQPTMLAHKKGTWIRHLSKTTPNPDIERLRQRRARAK